MQTFVWRDILDKSISGDKIFGGTINWIDGLYTDAIYVPHTGTSGVGTIDGSGVIIGINEMVGGVYTELAISDFVGVPALIGYGASMYVQGGSYGTILLKGIWSADIYLNAGGISYIIPKMIFGANSMWNSSNLFEVHGSMAAQDIVIQGGYTLSAPSATINSLNFYDHTATLINLTDVTEDLATLMGIFTIGSVLKEPWATINNWDDNVALALSTIPVSPFSISGSQWGYIGDLDQALTSVSSMNFADLTLVTFLEIGTVLKYATSSSEIDKAQFEYLAALDDDHTFGDIEVNSIKIGASSDVLSQYFEGIKTDTSFDWRASGGPGLQTGIGTTTVSFTVVGKLVTVHVKSEVAATPTDYLYYVASGYGGSRYDGRFEIPLTDSVFDNLPVPEFPAHTTVRWAYYVSPTTTELSNGVAYIDSSKKIIIQVFKNLTSITTPPAIVDFGVDSGGSYFRDTDACAILQSFTISYYAD